MMFGGPIILRKWIKIANVYKYIPFWSRVLRSRRYLYTLDKLENILLIQQNYHKILQIEKLMALRDVV